MKSIRQRILEIKPITMDDLKNMEITLPKRVGGSMFLKDWEPKKLTLPTIEQLQKIGIIGYGKIYG